MRLWQLADACPKPAPACSHLNQSLMELGALLHTAHTTAGLSCEKICVACRVANSKLPNLGKGPHSAVSSRSSSNAAISCPATPAGVVNAHLWEFPNVEANGSNENLSDVPKRFSSQAGASKPLVKHSITRYRITLEAHRVRLRQQPKQRPESGERRPPPLAFSSAHKNSPLQPVISSADDLL
jgi:adenine-specific DNA glycosylase